MGVSQKLIIFFLLIIWKGLHDLFGRAKALFDLVAPQEYGFDAEAKEEIGVLTSLPLLRKVWEDLDEAKTTGKSLACFYFTKESHITTFVHLLLSSGLPFTNVRIPELDYCSHCTIELWEKSTGSGQKDFSIRLSISEGAHSPAVLDSNVDAVSSPPPSSVWARGDSVVVYFANGMLQRHSLTVQPRKKLSSHIDYELARQCFSKHFNKGLSFSTTPLEVSLHPFRFPSVDRLCWHVFLFFFYFFILIGWWGLPQEIYRRRIGPSIVVLAPQGWRRDAQDDQFREQWQESSWSQWWGMVITGWFVKFCLLI